jgi:hypothetical protein
MLRMFACVHLHFHALSVLLYIGACVYVNMYMCVCVCVCLFVPTWVLVHKQYVSSGVIKLSRDSSAHKIFSAWVSTHVHMCVHTCTRIDVCIHHFFLYFLLKFVIHHQIMYVCMYVHPVKICGYFFLGCFSGPSTLYLCVYKHVSVSGLHV